jgi:hypothetical protein
MSVYSLAVQRNTVDRQKRFIVGMSFIVVTASVFVLAFLSMLYDFGECLYPTQEKPYFVSGRLISCALLPFLIIYIDGFERVFHRLKKRVYLLAAICLLAIIITCSEVSTTLEVFKSQYNWFHLKY